MDGLPRPLADALESLGLRIGPPLRIANEDLAEARCRTCHAPVWVVNTATPPLPFDVTRNEDGEPFLKVHGCFYDESDEKDS